MKADIYLGEWPGDCDRSEDHRRDASWFWSCKVPSALRRFDTGKLPTLERYREALAWATRAIENNVDEDSQDYPLMSALMFGGTGTGKTRTAYAVARYFVETGFIAPDSEFVDSGIVVLTGIEFANQVVSRTKPDGIGGFDEWMDELHQKELVILDDLDKAKMTPRVELELFNVLDTRTRKDHHTIITTQTVGEEFAALFSKTSKTGPAIIRRIREFFHPIDFDLAG